MILLILGCHDPTRSLHGSSAFCPKTSYGITYISPSREACMYHGSQVRLCTQLLGAVLFSIALTIAVLFRSVAVLISL